VYNKRTPEYTTGHRDITLSHSRRVSETMTVIRCCWCPNVTSFLRFYCSNL